MMNKDYEVSRQICSIEDKIIFRMLDSIAESSDSYIVVSRTGGSKPFTIIKREDEDAVALCEELTLVYIGEILNQEDLEKYVLVNEITQS